MEKLVDKLIRRLLQDQKIPKEHVMWHIVRCERVEEGVAYIVNVSPYAEYFKRRLIELLKKEGVDLKVVTSWD